MRELCSELNVQPLSAHGIRVENAAEIVEKASRASSMKGNPIDLTVDELREVLDRALALTP